MYIIDFDDTLFDTHGWKQARFASLEPLGISTDLVKKTYKDIRQKPNVVYSDDVHAEILATYDFPREEVKHVFSAIATPEILRKFVFDDTHEFLKEVKTSGKPMILLSTGDPFFQRKKVDAVGVTEYFDQIIFVQDKKEEMVGKILDRYDYPEYVYFINDKIEETKSVMAHYPNLIPLMKRSPDFDVTLYEQCGYPHFQTLEEMLRECIAVHHKR